MTEIVLVRTGQAPRAWRENLVGQRFGRLVVSEEAPKQGQARRWSCLCDCGASKTVQHGHLKGGKVASCGCLRAETARARLLVHGHAGRSDRSRTYGIWSGMLARCQNPSSTPFERYGAKGIDVCDRWQTFANFLVDMGECPDGHEIDRIRNEVGYQPGNCRWVTRPVQMQNRTNAHWIDFGGERLSVTQWARRIGVSKATLYERMEKWPLERALTEPKNV